LFTADDVQKILDSATDSVKIFLSRGGDDKYTVTLKPETFIHDPAKDVSIDNLEDLSSGSEGSATNREPRDDEDRDSSKPLENNVPDKKARRHSFRRDSFRELPETTLDDLPQLTVRTAAPVAKEEPKISLEELATSAPGAVEWMQKIDRWTEVMDRNTTNLRTKNDLLSAWKIRLDTIASRMDTSPDGSGVSTVTTGDKKAPPKLSQPAGSSMPVQKDSIGAMEQLQQAYVTIERQKIEISQLKANSAKQIEEATSASQAESEARTVARSNRLERQARAHQEDASKTRKDLDKSREEILALKTELSKAQEEARAQKEIASTFSALQKGSGGNSVEELVRFKVECESKARELGKAQHMVSLLEKQLEVKDVEILMSEKKVLSLKRENAKLTVDLEDVREQVDVSKALEDAGPGKADRQLKLAQKELKKRDEELEMHRKRITTLEEAISMYLR